MWFIMNFFQNMFFEKKHVFWPKMASVTLHIPKDFWWHRIFGSATIFWVRKFWSTWSRGGGARWSILADRLYSNACLVDTYGPVIVYINWPHEITSCYIECYGCTKHTPIPPPPPTQKEDVIWCTYMYQLTDQSRANRSLH